MTPTSASIVSLLMSCLLVVAAQRSPPTISGPFTMNQFTPVGSSVVIYSNPPYQFRIDVLDLVNASFDTTPPYGSSFLIFDVDVCCKTRTFGDVLGPIGEFWKGTKMVGSSICNTTSGFQTVDFWEGLVNVAFLDSLSGLFPFMYTGAQYGFKDGNLVCINFDGSAIEVNIDYKPPSPSVFEPLPCTVSATQCPWIEIFTNNPDSAKKGSKPVAKPSGVTYTAEVPSVHADMPTLRAPWNSTLSAANGVCVAAYDVNNLASFTAVAEDIIFSDGLEYSGVTVPMGNNETYMFMEFIDDTKNNNPICCNISTFGAEFAQPADATYAWKATTRLGSGTCNGNNVVFYNGAFNFRKPYNIAWLGDNLWWGFPATLNKTSGRLEADPVGDVANVCIYFPEQDATATLQHNHTKPAASTFAPFDPNTKCTRSAVGECPSNDATLKTAGRWPRGIKRTKKH